VSNPVDKQKKLGEITNIGTIEIALSTIIKPSTKGLMCIFVLRSGDIHINPGLPKRQSKNPCTNCSKGVIATSKAISCDLWRQMDTHKMYYRNKRENLLEYVKWGTS
jgi:hypothetical protein